MDYIIECKNRKVKKVLELVVPSMIADLKIKSASKCLVISVEEDCDSLGLTIEMPAVGGIIMILKPAKQLSSMLLTLAHELVHVKQIVSGKLKDVGDGSKRWNGKVYHRDTPYLEQPWELQAYAKQELVMRRAICNDD